MKTFLKMKTRILLLLLLILTCTITGCRADHETQVFDHGESPSEETGTFTKRELTQDLRQLENRIMERNPLAFADKKRLEQLFQSAYEDIEDGMT